MRLPVRIFSDLHLGHRASRIDEVEKLRPLFKGAGTVVFNGDTWEELAEPWRDRSAAMLEELRGIVAEEGCDAVFLRGNHDPGWDGPAWLELAGGRLVVTHGDALLRASAPWKREILNGGEAIEKIWREFPDAETDAGTRLELARQIALRLRSKQYPKDRTLLSRVLDAALPPQRALSILEAWIKQGKYGAAFCERYFPKAELLVIGHFHCSGIRRARGRTLLNLGSFVLPGRAKWAGWDGVLFSTGRISITETGWVMGAKTTTWKFI